MTTDQRRNLASFIARLAAVGVCGNTLTGCAVLLFRDLLETLRKITTLESTTSETELQISIEELLYGMVFLCSSQVMDIDEQVLRWVWPRGLGYWRTSYRLF